MVCLQSCLQLAMESLNHAIGLGMVGGGAGTLDTQQSHQCIPQFELKLVSDDGGRNTKTGNPGTEECLGHSFGSYCGEGNGFWPPSETVHTGEQVCRAT